VFRIVNGMTILPTAAGVRIPEAMSPHAELL